MKKINVLTHYDLDGAGSAIAAAEYLDLSNLDIHFTGYNNIENKLKKIKELGENLLILDLSLEQKHIDFIAQNFKKVFLIDHHQSSLDKNYPFKTTIDTSRCAAMLTSEYFQNKLNIEPFGEFLYFIEHVNDYDMFTLNLFQSRILNNIFWTYEYPINFVYDYLGGFKNHQHWMSSEQYKKGLKIEKEKKDYINNCFSFSEKNFRVIVADKYISDIPLHFDEQNFLIIRPKNTISFRTKNVDLSKFYDILNENGFEGSGGHPNAGGTQLKNENNLTELEKISDLFYEYIRNQNDQR